MQDDIAIIGAASSACAVRSICGAPVALCNGHTVNPARLTATLAELVRQKGGRFVTERVMKIIPREGRFSLVTNVSNRVFAAIVVAARAWSKRLLSPLGANLPLDTERGYHAMLPEASNGLRLPLLFKDRGLSITPMEHGPRIAGTLEIAGIDAVPDERRAHNLVGHAHALFSALQHGKPDIWMGFRPSFPDSEPAIGALPGLHGLVVAFGHGHTGMVGGAETGRLACDLVLDWPPAIDPAPYSPACFGGAVRAAAVASDSITQQQRAAGDALAAIRQLEEVADGTITIR